MVEGGVGKHYLLDEAIKFSLEKLGKSGLTIKPQQRDAIYELAINSRDVLAVLPTGFGKSLIFQILPFVFDFLDGKSSASSVIIISPLNGLIRDQIEKLKTYMTVGVLQVSSIVRDDSDDDGWDPTLSEQLLNSQLLFAHPEVFVDNKKLLNKFAHNERLQKRIKLIVVDEAHLISEWKDFRPAYGKLGLFSTVFPSSPKLALTATATRARRNEICISLGLLDQKVIEVNPDRRNICFSVSTRPNRGDDRLQQILSPLVDELKQKKIEAPKTLIYGSMEIIADCYMFFSQQLGMEQYYPAGAIPCAENRLFTQYHAQYPSYEQERILNEVIKSNSCIRYLFVTVAFGMGIDCPDVRRVIHIGPPRTMEEYFQEAGRAGRDGNLAEARIYYNSYDISKAKKNMQDVMRGLVTSNECRRQTILGYFGYSILEPLDPAHLCCDVHAQQCNCPMCCPMIDDAVEDMQNLSICEDNTTSVEDVNTCTVSASPPLAFHHELLAYRYKLTSGRTCVGSVSLSTGFSTELIDCVLTCFNDLNSVDDIMEHLPVYSRENAEAIFMIICKYKL